jgi:tetratricopeptide (TPR) repeat protein
MNILEKYEALVKQKKFEEAIPVIKEIITKNPKIDTSWFNYGVCLDEIGKYNDAAEAFIKAHELNISDYGIHYRILRSFSLAEDYSQLYEFIDYLCQTFKEEIETIFESEEFSKVKHRKEFIDLKSKYYEK